MPIKNRIAEFQRDMVAWRRDLHAHPELRYEEARTAELVAGKLAGWGIGVHRGLAGTGVVGTLRGDLPGNRAIALRADMDALPILEANHFAHASSHAGKMHACGHDGHTAMLLGAARYLAETRRFSGTVHFIFQPAEEGGSGALKMMEEGLFSLFPVEEVYGLHNMPGLPRGSLAGCIGPIMAATNRVEIRVTGKGGHAAYPHRTVDPVVIAAQIVTALQSVISRTTDPLHSVVLSITQFHAGRTDNVIPDEALLGGTLRTFSVDIRDRTAVAIRSIVNGVAEAFGAQAEAVIHPGYPPTVNTAEQLAKAMRAAGAVVGDEQVNATGAPSMGGEDFAYMLNEKPGAYIFIGAGESAPSLHQSDYDFDDELLPIGASYWAELAETVLSPS